MKRIRDPEDGHPWHTEEYRENFRIAMKAILVVALMVFGGGLVR